MEISLAVKSDLSPEMNQKLTQDLMHAIKTETNKIRARLPVKKSEDGMMGSSFVLGAILLELASSGDLPSMVNELCRLFKSFFKKNTSLEFELSEQSENTKVNKMKNEIEMEKKCFSISLKAEDMTPDQIQKIIDSLRGLHQLGKNRNLV